MQQVFFISDLHLGHKKILDFSPNRKAKTVDEHSEWLVTQWNSKVGKKDLAYVLGDVCFDKKHFKYLNEMHGTKKLILGNNDKFSIKRYLKYFKSIHGFKKKYNFWLSHCPIHDSERRNRINIHGHTHDDIILDLKGKPDPNYVNVCVDPLNGIPIGLDEI